MTFIKCNTLRYEYDLHEIAIHEATALFLGTQRVKNASGQSQQPITEEQWCSRSQT